MRPCCRYPLSIVAAFVALAVLVSVTAAQVDFAAPVSTIRDGESGIILLQDGGVLTGQITRAADWYVVGRAGGQIQVAADRVLFVGHSLHEAYEYHRKSLSGDSVEMHLALAGWCLRHDLLSDAGNELDAARKLGPNHPKLALLERWLTTAKERPDPTPPSTSQPPPPTSVRANSSAKRYARSSRWRSRTLYSSRAASACKQLHGFEMPPARRTAIVPTEPRNTSRRGEPSNDDAESCCRAHARRSGASRGKSALNHSTTNSRWDDRSHLWAAPGTGFQAFGGLGHPTCTGETCRRTGAGYAQGAGCVRTSRRQALARQSCRCNAT